MKLEVKVQKDHLARVVQRFTPTKALAELIWNALDADATRVDIHLDKGKLAAIETVRVVDNGAGMSHHTAAKAFTNLGNSQKKGRRSPGGRPLHGEKGEGRFAALSIGNQATWNSNWRSKEGVEHVRITASANALGLFELDEPHPSASRETGTEIEIANIDDNSKILKSETTPTHLAEIFALYLLQYPDVQIWFDGQRVDPSSVQEHFAHYSLPSFPQEDGTLVSADLTVIEWKHKVGRELVLCDSDGCTLNTRAISFHTPGFSNYSVYLKSSYLREKQSILDLEEMHRDLQHLVDLAKSQVKKHFRRRGSELARGIVEQWKKDKVYPFDGVPVGPLQTAERQVFDIVALNLTEYAPGFAPADPTAKKVSFQILKAAIEKSPDTVRRIIHEVLELPQAKRDELIDLLDHTTLASMITANKVVLDRQKFLKGLEVVLYHYEAKKKTKERAHLQKILGDAAWIFGEEYHLAVDDQGLDTVLHKHQSLLGEDRGEVGGPVRTLEGKRGIIDLMLSKRVRLPRADEYEHLVVELKRPSQKINAKVLEQIENYAFAVAADERFKNSKVKWVFWALSNEMDAYAERKASQANRPRGLIYQSENPSITIWAKTWSQILDEAEGRMEFYRQQLDIMVTQEEGLSHLQSFHSDHLPELSFQEA